MGTMRWLALAALVWGCDGVVMEMDAGPGAAPGTDAGPGADAGAQADAGAESDGGAAPDAGAPAPDPLEGPGTFVAVGWRQRVVTVDEAGATLHSHEDTSADPYDKSRLYRDVVHGHAGFVIAGDAELLHSVDGTSWTSIEKPTSGFLGGIAYGNGRYVAAGSTPISSDDGVTWQTGDRLRVTIRGIGFGDGVFVVVGDDGFRARSVDGVTWTDRVEQGAGLQNVAWGDGRFVAVGHGGRRVTSIDGITWEEGDAGGDSLRAVIYARGQWVAVGDDGTFVSPDASLGSWTAIETPAFNGVAYGGGRWLATVGRTVMASDDARSWVEVAGGESGFWDVAFGPAQTMP